MNLLIDLQYFPSVILFKIINKTSNVVFEQYDFYQKMSFRNRCTIAGAQGPVHLSIPLEKGRDQKTLMKDVRIAGTRKWQDQHWKALLASYSRSPWFDYYRDSLESLYHKSFDFLMDWDLACFEWSLGALAWPVETTLTEAYRKDHGEGWLDGRGKILPKNILTGQPEQEGAPAAGQLSSSAAGAAGETGRRLVSVADSWEPLRSALADPPLRYRQVFEERTGFIPHLSILDLIFCEGKRASSLFEGTKTTKK